MSFQIHHTLDKIRNYLPHQASLKDFIHHNTLDAFQKFDFFKALECSKTLFGNQTHLDLNTYQRKYLNGEISTEALEYAITAYGDGHIKHAFDELLWRDTIENTVAEIGKFRQQWESHLGFDIEHHVQIPLFKLLSAYLDQGVAYYQFPKSADGFLKSILNLHASSRGGLFKSQRIQQIIQHPFDCTTLLALLVSNEQYYETYLWDLLYSHPGWSGFVNVVEHDPNTLFNTVSISLHDLCIVELLFEIDSLDQHFGTHWCPLGHSTKCEALHVDKIISNSNANIAVVIWQNALEWTWYDQLIKSIQKKPKQHIKTPTPEVQMIVCIDDRESSFRMHVEQLDLTCETFGTPGFFGVPVFFKPQNSKHLTKLCPAPVTPKHLVLQLQAKTNTTSVFHFSQRHFNLSFGWLLSLSYGFISLFNLIYDLIYPHEHTSGTLASTHMDVNSELYYEFHAEQQDSIHSDIQLGFKPDEMYTLAFNFLNQLGIHQQFAPVVYIIAHGASSQNNPHYAAYDCGACSGRPGSVNARLMALFLNRMDVRQMLSNSGITIPQETTFIAALHDTTRDEIFFYDLKGLTQKAINRHLKFKLTLQQALQNNAAERSRKFESIALHTVNAIKHIQVKRRSVSLFEPRPELNHATNCYCIIGPRSITKQLFLDRRAFLNSYDPYNDEKGDILSQLLKPIGPVCGGINLEYYFSKVDNNKLGAGSKLPHNVVGLFGVSNGIDGDLRTGLPFQMIDVHDPLRLLVIIYQNHIVVNHILQHHNDIKSWYAQNWMHLICIDPLTHIAYQYKNDAFKIYEPFTLSLSQLPIQTLTRFKTRNTLPISILTDEN